MGFSVSRCAWSAPISLLSVGVAVEFSLALSPLFVPVALLGGLPDALRGRLRLGAGHQIGNLLDCHWPPA
jgi:hypothetical protein